MEHVQEDIVLEPRVRTVCFVHGQAHCPHCDKDVVLPGPGELLGSYIGPATKATATYMRRVPVLPSGSGLGSYHLPSPSPAGQTRLAR